MIKNKENKLYTGITTNPDERVYYHNNGRGANFTKDSSTFAIVFLEEYISLAEVRKREIQIKKWSRVKKEKLIELYMQKLDTRL